jgi:MFS family permease
MLAFFVTFFARLTISPVLPFIIADFDITNTEIGIGLTGMWLAYGVTQYPSGVLGDRFGERPIILVAIGGTAVASLLLALSPWFVLFVVLAVLLGAVAGLHYTVGTTLLSYSWDEMGYAVGVHSLGAPLAGLIAPATAAWIGVRYGWRPAVGLTVLIAVPVFVLFWWRIRPTPPRRSASDVRGLFSLGPLVEVLSRPRVVFTLSIAIIGTFNVQGIISFLPTFLVEYQGNSTSLAAFFFSGYFVSRGIFQIGIGRLSDRVGRDFALAICMITGTVGVALIVVDRGFLVTGSGLTLMGIGGSFFAALDPRFLDVISDSKQGTEFGLVRTAYAVIGGLGPVCVGAIADIFGWAIAFATLAVLYTFAFGALSINWAFELGL